MQPHNSDFMHGIMVMFKRNWQLLLIELIESHVISEKKVDKFNVGLKISIWPKLKSR